MVDLTKFEPEPGRGLCGDSFASGVTVSGVLPRTGGFGANLQYDIPPYIAFSTTEDAAWDAEALAAVRQAIENARQRIVDDKFALREWFSQKELRTLTLMLQQADRWSTRAQTIWDKWVYRPGGTWPLWLEDDVGSVIGQVCNDVASPGSDLEYITVMDWLDEGEFEAAIQQGITVQDYDFGPRCPWQVELVRRPIDRERISTDLQNALRALRCAEYHLHRVALYRQAKQAWSELPGRPRPSGPQGFRATPAGQGGPRIALPTEIPDTPEGSDLPDPDDLVPEGVVVEPTPPKKRSAWPVVAAGGAAVLGVTALVVGLTRM